MSVAGVDPVLAFPLLSLQTMAAQLPPATPQLTAVEDALKEVEDQLNCAICLDPYKDPNSHMYNSKIILFNENKENAQYFHR